MKYKKTILVLSTTSIIIFMSVNRYITNINVQNNPQLKNKAAEDITREEKINSLTMETKDSIQLHKLPVIDANKDVVVYPLN